MTKQNTVSGQGQMNIPHNFEIKQPTVQSNLKTNKYGTKHVESNRIDSATSASTVISNKKNVLPSSDDTYYSTESSCTKN